MDIVFELARQFAQRRKGAATVVDEVHGFKFFDDRDPLGFVDGSANPEGERAAGSPACAWAAKASARSSRSPVTSPRPSLKGSRTWATSNC